MKILDEHHLQIDLSLIRTLRRRPHLRGLAKTEHIIMYIASNYLLLGLLLSHIHLSPYTFQSSLKHENKRRQEQQGGASTHPIDRRRQ